MKPAKNKPGRNTNVYVIEYMCSNCYKIQSVELIKGTIAPQTIREKCNNCGCTELLRGRK